MLDRIAPILLSAISLGLLPFFGSDDRTLPASEMALLYGGDLAGACCAMQPSCVNQYPTEPCKGRNQSGCADNLSVLTGPFENCQKKQGVVGTCTETGTHVCQEKYDCLYSSLAGCSQGTLYASIIAPNVCTKAPDCP